METIAPLYPRGQAWHAEASLAEERSPVDRIKGIIKINFKEYLFQSVLYTSAPSINQCKFILYILIYSYFILYLYYFIFFYL